MNRYCLPVADFVDEEILPRFAGNRPGLADDTFPIEQLPQQASDRAADRIDRVRIAAEPPDHPRHIDPAAAGIAALRFAAKLGHGLDAVDRCRKIHGRIERDGNDSVMRLGGWFEPRTSPR